MASAETIYTKNDNLSPRNSAVSESDSQNNGVHRRKSSLLGISVSEQENDSVAKNEGSEHSNGFIEDAKKRAAKIFCVVINIGRNLVSHWELPDWMQDNEFLHHFHRPQLDSVKKCFKSMFSLHSETGNIWTHFIGFLMIATCWLTIFIWPAITKSDYPQFPKGAVEYLIFTSFFIGAQCCMIFSWLFHTLSCHSINIKNSFAQLDYSGIALLITGSAIPVFYYGFYCRAVEKYVYIGLVLTLCVPAIGISLLRKIAQPRFRPLRAGVFLVFGLSNIIPIIHLGVLMGFQYMVDAVAIKYVIIMGILYISGAMLYVFRVPERFLPGTLNLIFQSHQIFHILVVAAALIHLYAMCQMANFRVKQGRSCN